MAKPRYQGLQKESIPSLDLPEGAGTLRVIAGEYENAKGPTKTFTAINMWDLNLKAGHTVRLKVPAGHTTSAFVLSGKIEASSEQISEATIAVFERDGDELVLKVLEDSKVLFLGGEPIDEPIVGYGPFVMNSIGEIKQAFIDFEEGRMGQLGKINGSDR